MLCICLHFSPFSPTHASSCSKLVNWQVRLKLAELELNQNIAFTRPAAPSMSHLHFSAGYDQIKGMWRHVEHGAYPHLQHFP